MKDDVKVKLFISLFSDDFSSYAPPTEPNGNNPEMLMHHGYSTVIQPSPYMQDNSNMSVQNLQA